MLWTQRVNQFVVVSCSFAEVIGALVLFLLEQLRLLSFSTQLHVEPRLWTKGRAPHHVRLIVQPQCTWITRQSCLRRREVDDDFVSVFDRILIGMPGVRQAGNVLTCAVYQLEGLHEVSALRH